MWWLNEPNIHSYQKGVSGAAAFARLEHLNIQIQYRDEWVSPIASDNCREFAACIFYK